MDYYFLQIIDTLMLLKRYKIRKKDSKLFQRMADSICWGCYIKDNCDHGKAIYNRDIGRWKCTSRKGAPIFQYWRIDQEPVIRIN